MKPTCAAKINDGWSNGGDEIRLHVPGASGHGHVGVRLMDYLRLVIASLQSDHGFSEDEAAELTLNLTTVLCISDAHSQGYTPEATACAVFHSHHPSRLS